MKWTSEALACVAHVLVAADDDSIDAAIAYAEQLADETGSTVVDSDLWRQAWTVVTRAQRLARHHPPKHHHEISDAT